jgi:CRP/FNR family nitrogen fixation transcriptional regulator
MLMQTSFQAVATRPSPERSRTAPARAGIAALVVQMDLMGARMSFTRNSEIYGENEPADYVYKVVSGAVRTYKIFDDGRLSQVKRSGSSSATSMSSPPRPSTTA